MTNKLKPSPQTLKKYIENHVYHLSHEELSRCHEKGEGYLSFIPSGFSPVLIPYDLSSPLLESATKDRDFSKHSMANVIQGKSVSTLPNTNVFLSSCVLADIEKGPPPRPPNVFILYRRDIAVQIKQENPEFDNSQISKRAADLWKNESFAVKLHYQQMAEKQKILHHERYPGYKYSPKQKGEKKKRSRENAKNKNVMDSSHVRIQPYPTQYQPNQLPTQTQINHYTNIFNVGDGYSFYDQDMTSNNYEKAILKPDAIFDCNLNEQYVEWPLIREMSDLGSFSESSTLL